MESFGCISIFLAIFVMVISIPQSHSQPQYSEEMQKIVNDITSTCNAKFPITDEIKTNINSGTWPDDRNLKCFLMCYMQQFSVIDEKGILNGDILIGYATAPMKPAVEEVVNSCKKDITGNPDICEVAFNYMTCAAKMYPNIILMTPFKQ